ncbi:MAG: PAC2 family protein [Desulfurococcaceae archaeon]
MARRETVIGGLRFVEYEERAPEKPGALLVALPDAGLVGVIAASYLISKLGLREVGGIEIPRGPYLVVIQRGEPRPPIRLFAGEGLAVAYTEFVLSPDAQAELAEALVEYARVRGFDSVIGLTGLPIQNRLDVEGLRTYYVATSEDLAKLVAGGGAEALEQGVVVGAFAVLLREGARKGVRVAVLLTESFMEFPDPEAAAEGLKVLSRLLGTEVDVGELLQQAGMVKLKARELMRQTANALAQVGKDMEYRPSLYA